MIYLIILASSILGVSGDRYSQEDGWTVSFIHPFYSSTQANKQTFCEMLWRVKQLWPLPLWNLQSDALEDEKGDIFKKEKFR